MHLSCAEYTAVGLLVAVSRLLVCWTVYNHLRDAFLLHRYSLKKRIMKCFTHAFLSAIRQPKATILSQQPNSTAPTARQQP